MSRLSPVDLLQALGLEPLICAHRLTKLFKNPKLDIEWVLVDDER